jgi:hypothetical protein
MRRSILDQSLNDSLNGIAVQFHDRSGNIGGAVGVKMPKDARRHHLCINIPLCSLGFEFEENLCPPISTTPEV